MMEVLGALCVAFVLILTIFFVASMLWFLIWAGRRIKRN